MFAHVKFEFADQFFQVVKVRAGGAVEAVLGDARGQFDHDLVFCNALFVFAFVDKIIELSMKSPAAATAAGQVKRAKGFVCRVVLKSAGSLKKCPFTHVA